MPADSTADNTTADNAAADNAASAGTGAASLQPVTASEHDVLVIGAGPAGLAAAAELGRLGLPATVLERSDVVASSWRGRYDRLRLNTSRLSSPLPGSRFPKGTPLFPPRDQYVRYLEGYAASHGLDIRFGVQVTRIERADGGHWRGSTAAGGEPARPGGIPPARRRPPRRPDLARRQ